MTEEPAPVIKQEQINQEKKLSNLPEITKDLQQSYSKSVKKSRLIYQ